MVRKEPNRPPGISGLLPAIMMTAIVSPMARPTPRMRDAVMDDFAAGTIVLNTACSWVAPKARAPSYSSCGTASIPFLDSATTVGKIMMPSTKEVTKSPAPSPVGEMLANSGMMTAMPKKP